MINKLPDISRIIKEIKRLYFVLRNDKEAQIQTRTLVLGILVCFALYYGIASLFIEPGQKIYGWHKDKKYEARVMPDGNILLQDGRKFSSLSMAAFKGIIGHEVNAWNWWRTVGEDGREYKLDELRKELGEILRKEYENDLSP